MTLDEIKAALAARVLDVCLLLYPNGRKHGADWCCGDLDGNPGQSFKINVALKPGVWKDFASGEGGDNLLDLWMKRHGLPDITTAAEEAASWLGVSFERRGASSNGGSSSHDRARAAINKAKANGAKTQAAPSKPAPAAEGLEPEHPVWDGWDACVEAFDERWAQGLAEARGISAEFFLYLKDRKLIGVYGSGTASANVAFPVHDARGRLIACHYRVQSPKWTGEGCVDENGKPIKRWGWGYEPTGRGTHPLVIGDTGKAHNSWVFESQWDAWAVLDRMGVHEMEESFANTFQVLITRGAANGKLVRRAARDGRKLYLWPQNDAPDPRTGKIPSEEWVKTIVEEIGQVPAARVQTPKEYEDPAEWVKQVKPEMVTIMDLVGNAQPARESKLPKLRDMAYLVKPENRPPKPPEIIKGLLHRGSKLIIGGTSKGRKSFSLLDMACSIASGTPWWGFPTHQGRVCYLNFEIQEPFLAERVDTIARAKKVTLPPGMFSAMTLRGNTEKIENLADELITYLHSVAAFHLIIFDPIYKLMCGKDENKAGDVTDILQQLEHIAVRTGAAVAFGAHYSKGNQAAKESIDRIGGSGAFARDPDSILTMTTHQEEGCFTVETTLRNYAPQDPFVVRWEHPLFQRDGNLDPAALKMPKGAKQRAAEGGEQRPVRKNDSTQAAIDAIGNYFTDPEAHWHFGDLLKDSNLPKQTLAKYIRKLADSGFIQKLNGKWTSNGLVEQDPQTP